MTQTKIDLIFHPVRLRIITAITANQMTASEIARILPDIPQTTLYRHINTLVENGLLEVVEENPIRGTVERVYAMTMPPSLKPEDLKGLKKEDYEQFFTLFLTTLMQDFQRFMDNQPDNDDLNLIQAGVEINKADLYLNDQEYNTLKEKLNDTLMEAVRLKPGKDRKRRTLSYLILSAEK
jgi:DNA-binding transcriptional ArsR family regulator